MTSIKFVTDSVCDIPPALVEQWNIVVVPCFVNYGGESYADDGVHLNRAAYYDGLADMDETPTTAAMPPAVVKDYVEPILGEAEHIIAITTPAKLSGINNAFRLAFEQMDIDADRYTLLDSGSLSLGIAFQVLLGAEVAAETGDVAETLAAIERVKRQTKVYATVGSMEFLRRSGRVGWATAGVANLLNIKPVVDVIEGEVEVRARVRTFNRAVDKLADLAAEQKPVDRIGMLHINNPDGIDRLQNGLDDMIDDNTLTGLIGPTLGTHIGPGSVGVVTVGHGWKA